MYCDENSFATEEVDLTTDFVPSLISIYQIRFKAAGTIRVHFTGDPETHYTDLVIATANLTAEYRIDKIYKTGTGIAAASIQIFGPPKGVGLQRLYGFVYRAGTQPAIGVPVRATINGYAHGVNSDYIAQQVIETTTNSSGYFELTLVYGAQALITAAASDRLYLSQYIIVSKSAAKSFSDY